MEWVECTARTVEAAKEAALDELGVDEQDAEFEVLEEPKPGLFGRLRSEARVRARVVPSAARPRQEWRDRRRGRRDRPESGARTQEGSAETTPGTPGRSVGDGRRDTGERSQAAHGQAGRGQAGRGRRAASPEGADMHDDNGWNDADADERELAEEFLSGLLDRFGAAYELKRRELEEGLVEIGVIGDDLGILIGPRGQTLLAVQELTRTVVQRRARGRSGRIVVDVAGYRQARREALDRFARQVAEEVLRTGVAKALEPMPAPDRKVVHDAVNSLAGVATISEGEEPRRHVVITVRPGEGTGPA